MKNYYDTKKQMYQGKKKLLATYKIVPVSENGNIRFKRMPKVPSKIIQIYETR